MACIIKLPGESKGIISFTSQERDKLIYKSPTLQRLLKESSNKWLYLLHHNWQPCQHDDFFDASLCNHMDLTNKGECLDMDCCNFSPMEFMPRSSSDKWIDVLYVTRVVSFKRLNVFFDICKKLLDKNKDIKIVLIASIPEVDCDPKNPKQIYLEKFSREERRRFLAIFFDYDYPFSMDKYYLSNFYNSSKTFLHTSNNEYHSRVCSYALACGVPVVGYKSLVSFIGTDNLKEPLFYDVKNDSEYISQIENAIENHKSFEHDVIKNVVCEDFSIHTFKNRLSSLFQKKGLTFVDEHFFPKNLDFRLGRHLKISLGDNSLDISIEELMSNYKIGYELSGEEDLEVEIEKRINSNML